MDYTAVLRPYAHQPLTHQLLVSLFKGYQRPNDKINRLVKEGWIQSVKRGLYVAGERLNSGSTEPFLLANHILGPSYVSLETALSYYGLIPERVYEVASVTTKATRTFKTGIGTFTYTRLPLPYYTYGINQVKFAKDQYALVAKPEKALCDKIITTPGLLFRSQKAGLEFLLDNMRMDESSLKKLNTTEMATWLPESPKEESLRMLVTVIKKL
ncbi:MAG TPA: hypothetical protein VFM90_05080 [Cyclobacteriaceae bacterium]|nr:hypothetical protein [Cyclobacteriaceae bacterium]